MIASSLKSDRLIKITVGSNKNDEPFLISQRRLESASEYFCKALRLDSFKEGRTGQIDFPEDDYDAWAVLVFWMTNTFNIEKYEVAPDLLVKCWVLGDKYEIPEFHDQIMLELLRIFESTLATEGTIKLGSELSPADSVLGRLIAEEAANCLRNREVDFESLEAAFSGYGMLKHFVLARDKCERDKNCYDTRFEDLAADRTAQGKSVKRPSWRDYMISTGSRPQWLFEPEHDGRRSV